MQHFRAVSITQCEMFMTWLSTRQNNHRIVFQWEWGEVDYWSHLGTSSASSQIGWFNRMTATYSIHIPGVSFEEEAEIAFSVKDVLLEEISKGGVRPFGGVWKQYSIFSQRRKTWPFNDPNAYSFRCNNVCHNSPAKLFSDRATKRMYFLNVTQVIGLSCNSLWH